MPLRCVIVFTRKVNAHLICSHWLPPAVLPTQICLLNRCACRPPSNSRSVWPDNQVTRDWILTAGDRIDDDGGPAPFTSFGCCVEQKQNRLADRHLLTGELCWLIRFSIYGGGFYVMQRRNPTYERISTTQHWHYWPTDGPVSLAFHDASRAKYTAEV